MAGDASDCTPTTLTLELIDFAAMLEERVKTHGKIVVILTGRNIHSQVLKEILA